MEIANINKVLQLFNMLSKTEQLEVADKIDKQTFEERWQKLDNNLPDILLSDEDIIKEVQAVRYGKKDYGQNNISWF